METRVDVAVVGRTVAGIAAALEASRCGARVALVDPLGATARVASVDPHLVMDLAMARSHAREPADPATWRHDARRAARARMRAWARRVRDRGVLPFASRIEFASSREILLEGGGRLCFERAVVATGARPRRPGWTRPASRCCLDPHRLFDADAPIRSALVVGAGDVGCELALLLARQGARVTLVDRRDRLLRGLDRFLREALHAALHAAGVDVVLGEPIASIRADGRPDETHAEVRLASGRIERCDAVVLALGMLAEVENLGLDGIGVQRGAAGELAVDERWATTCPRLLAVGPVIGGAGDVVSQWCQGQAAGRSAAGREAAPPGTSPQILRAEPPLAGAGLTDEACERLGVEHAAHVVEGDPRAPSHAGIRLKLVVDARGALLGVHAVGPGADRLARSACGLVDAGVRLAHMLCPSSRIPPALARAARAADNASLPVGHDARATRAASAP